MTITFDATLPSGLLVTVRFVLHGPDPDAGLPDGIGEIDSVRDEAGREVELTKEEEDWIYERGFEMAKDWNSD